MAAVFEGRPTLAPAICFICEAANEGRWIDTHRNFEPFVLTNLSGRKFVCEGCVETFAHMLGYASKAEAERLRSEVEILVAKLYEAHKKEKIADAAINGALAFAEDFGFVPAAPKEESVPDVVKIEEPKPRAKKAPAKKAE